MTTRNPDDGEVVRFGDLNEFCEMFYDVSANALIVQAPTSGTDNTPVDRITVNAGGTLQMGVTGTGLVNIRRDDTAITAALRIEQDSTGDPVLEFLLTGGAEWSMGVDNGSSDIFVISAGGDLGTGDEDAIRITDAAPPVATYNAVHPTGTFDFVCDTCHWHGGTLIDHVDCEGVAYWHDDVGALAVALETIPYNLQESAGMRHLADLGVLSMTQDDEGRPWTGINMAMAQWFTWSGMQQMANRIAELEAKAA